LLFLFFKEWNSNYIILCSDNDLERHVGCIYYVNNVKWYSYRCCSSSSCENDLGSVHIYCNSALASNFTDYPWGKHSFVCCVTRSSNFCQDTIIKWEFCLFVSAEKNCLYIYRYSISVTEKILAVITAYVCRTDGDISTTCFKRSGRRGEFVLTNYHLCWDKV
jgi:hypothetical protein